MTGDEGARRLIAVLSEHGLTAATCESLTAGLVAATITTVPG
ncbi:CinA family protein, partial [Cutibacterium acnes subsp. acnes]|nr:CinA family protein [Cutibacterium acnes subsp. acnes]